MKITRLPQSVEAESAKSERHLYEFLAELRIISNDYGLALGNTRSILKFAPDVLEVRYTLDESRGALMPEFKKTCGEPVELP
jgi:hypothetical protein